MKKSRRNISNRALVKVHPVNNMTDSITPVSVDLPTKVSILSISLGTLMSLSNPAISIGVIVFGTVLPMIWSSPESSSGDLWKSISDRIAEQINQAIESLVFNTAKQELEGISKLSTDFSSLVTIWGETNTSLSALKSKYHALDSALMASIPRFKINGHENTLLHFYSLAAFIHLSLLRFGYDKFEEWNLDSNSKISMKQYLAERIDELLKEYTDHILSTYRVGLNIVKEDWLKQNEYINISTVTALDFATVLQMFSPTTYNINIGHRSLNRQLLEILNTKNKYNNFESLKKEIHRPVYILDTLTINESAIFSDTDFIFGINGVSYSLKSVDGFEIYQNKDYGTLKDLPPLPSFNSYYDNHIKVNNNPIISLSGNHVDDSTSIGGIGEHINIVGIITKLNILFYNKTTAQTSNIERHNNLQPFSIGNPTQHANNVFSKNRPELTMHKLNGMSVHYDNNKNDRSYGFLWQHDSVEEGSLLKLTQRSIYLHHAIKSAHSIFLQDLDIIDGPGFTGGDLVRLKPSNNITFKFTSNKLDNLYIYGKYRVRVFYVRRKGLDLNFSLTFRWKNEMNNIGIAHDDINFNETFHTGDEDAVISNINFSDISFFTFSNPVMLRNLADKASLIVQFINTSLLDDDWIIIDRIEFVPEF